MGGDGDLAFYNGTGATLQLVADVSGYYRGVLGEPAASCAGFTNSTGITDSTITLANASDISGPVPGLYLGAQQGAEAYAAYFNSVSDICGRSLAVDALDTESSTSGDQQAATTACANDFAMVGSLSLFDDGGAATAAGCGIPDLRARTTSAARRDAANSFAVTYNDISSVPSAAPAFFVQHNPVATAHAAMLWVNAAGYPAEAQSELAGWTSAGFSFKYSAGIDVNAVNYMPYVSAMITQGVQYVQFVGPPQYGVRLAQAMKAQSFSPILVVNSLTGDTPYASAGGSDVDGTYRIDDTTLLDAATNAELARYETWLQVVAPGAVPSTVGLYGWSAAMLFAQQALMLGGHLTRANLISALGQVSNWTGNGLQAPEAVGAKTPSSCVAIDQLNSGTWQHASPPPYVCGSLISTGGA